MPSVRVSRETVFKAMQSNPVRAALKAKADKIASRANSMKPSPDTKVWVEEGTRPKGRPYGRVLCDDVDQEYGTADTPKIRLLGRAAGI